MERIRTTSQGFLRYHHLPRFLLNCWLQIRFSQKLPFVQIDFKRLNSREKKSVKIMVFRIICALILFSPVFGQGKPFIIGQNHHN